MTDLKEVRETLYKIQRPGIAPDVSRESCRQSVPVLPDAAPRFTRFGVSPDHPLED